jgi:CBS domain containing-hemolysin-like protein
MLLVIAVLCALCEAVFTAMEVALGAVSRARIRTLAEEEQAERARDEHAPVALPAPGGAEPAAPTAQAPHAVVRRFVRRERSRPERLLALLEKPERLTLAFITVTSLSLWAAGALLAWQAMRDGWSAWTLVAALGGILFFAEAVPLVIAAHNPEGVALRCVGLIEKSVRVLSPVALVLGGLGSLVARALGARVGARPRVTEGELRHALDQAEHEGVIESEERAMLEGALEFQGKTVREVMTPRLSMVAVPTLMPLRAVLDVAMRGGHSRLPVYQGSTDHIAGIIATKDLLPHLRPPRRPPADTVDTADTAPIPRAPDGAVLTAGDVARPAFFLPAGKRVDAVIDDLRRQRMLMAIVVEPDGGTAGLVTLEDLLEEIVGEIEDEYDEAEAPLRLLLPTADFVADSIPNASSDGAPAPQVLAVGVGDRVEAAGAAASEAGTRPLGIEADASCSVRQAEKFWRRHLSESIVLFERAASTSPPAASSSSGVNSAAATGTLGSAAASSEAVGLPSPLLSTAPVADEALSLAALAQKLFDGVPRAGDCARAGTVFPRSATREQALQSPALGYVRIEVTRTNGPRLEEVRLVREDLSASATEARTIGNPAAIK